MQQAKFINRVQKTGAFGEKVIHRYHSVDTLIFISHIMECINVKTLQAQKRLSGSAVRREFNKIKQNKNLIRFKK
jgi:hypothetical protein